MRKESILGYIDWCHEDFLSRVEIINMGKALGLEEEDYKYYWKLLADGSNLSELLTDTDVISMAQLVGPCRYVYVEAVLAIPQPVAANEEEEDDSESDLHDSDYDFNDDEDMDNDESVSLVSENMNETVDVAETARVGENEHVETTPVQQPQIDCESSDYADSEQLMSCSDSDNEGLSRPRYADFMDEMMSNPKLEVGMKFSSFQQFKEACKNYGIRNRYVINFNPNDKKRCKAKCKKQCPFYLWAAVMSPDNPTVQIKSGVLTHTCSKDHNIRHVNSKWLSMEYLEQFRADPTWKLEGIIQAVRANQKVEISKVVAYREKKAA